MKFQGYQLGIEYMYLLSVLFTQFSKIRLVQSGGRKKKLVLCIVLCMLDHDWLIWYSQLSSLSCYIPIQCNGYHITLSPWRPGFDSPYRSNIFSYRSTKVVRRKFFSCCSNFFPSRMLKESDGLKLEAGYTICKKIIIKERIVVIIIWIYM